MIENGREEEVSSSSKPPAVTEGSRGRGRGRARGGSAKKARWGGVSSDEEAVTSESEEEVLSRPAPARESGRPARNCRRSTNYAEIEKAFDTMDSDEFEQSLLEESPVKY